MSKIFGKIIKSVSQVIKCLEAYSRVSDDDKISGPYSLNTITERLKEIKVRLNILSILAESDRSGEEPDATESSTTKLFGNFSLN
ncbi:MAG: hypothetical protein JXB24_00205 [Bacteroidales bacterium]|nr:hypothetical protein [Bacteroidales bacterium]